jgi:hypothetical protein
MATAGRSLANKNAKITLKSISYAFLAYLENKTILKYRKKEGICRLVVIFSSYGKFCRQNLPGLANCLYYWDNILFQSARNLPVTCQKGNHLLFRLASQEVTQNSARMSKKA